ncbi:hypothetical protein [Streptomyces nigrescens]|uniref:hypothetical protein n=1 Tax=Streptomyces nigrescens TaxID=1920 RepID=UPI0036FF2899
MPRAVPPLPGIPRYTSWTAVPEGLYTKTQLAALTPPRKPAAAPVGQVLYHGNSYAPLYPLKATTLKPVTTPEQRARLDAARALQYVCRRCGNEHAKPLGRGRLCESCRPAVCLWNDHQAAQAQARELVADHNAVLLVLAAGPHPPVRRSREAALDEPQTVAVIRLHDRAVLYRAPVGKDDSSERLRVLDHLDTLLADRRIMEEAGMGPVSRHASRLLKPADQCLTPEHCRKHSWLSPHPDTPRLDWLWAQWFAWTDHEMSQMAGVPDDLPDYWTRSADAAADGNGLVDLLHRIADGTAPVWDKARWLTDGWGEPES